MSERILQGDGKEFITVEDFERLEDLITHLDNLSENPFKVYKKTIGSLNLIRIGSMVTAVYSGITSNNQVLPTIPEGYRPEYPIPSVFVGAGNGNQFCYLSIGINGVSSVVGSSQTAAGANLSFLTRNPPPVEDLVE